MIEVHVKAPTLGPEWQCTPVAAYVLHTSTPPDQNGNAHQRQHVFCVLSHLQGVSLPVNQVSLTSGWCQNQHQCLQVNSSTTST